MAVQSRLDNTTEKLILSGNTLVREAETLLQDAGRAVPLATYTLMAQIAATKKWVPFTDETAVDGSAIAKGVFMGDAIAAADLVAGDVVDQPIITGGAAATIDSDLLVIENSKSLDTVVGAATVEAHRVEDDLNEIGIFVEDTTAISDFENA